MNVRTPIVLFVLCAFAAVPTSSELRLAAASPAVNPGRFASGSLTWMKDPSYVDLSHTKLRITFEG